MTCIVGIEGNDEVWIGGDRCVSNFTTEEIIDESKVFEVEDFLIGYSGSYRTLQVIKYGLEDNLSNRKPDVSDMKYLTTTFINDLITTLEYGGILWKENSTESGNQDLILGYRGNLYCVGYDFSILKSSNKYLAVGSGGQVARGSVKSDMTVVKPDYEFDYKQIIERALKAACHHSTGVREPIDIKSKEVTEENYTEEIKEFIKDKPIKQVKQAIAEITDKEE